jgi:WD40 repeat protein
MTEAQEEYDEEPTFIDMNSAVEVNVPDEGEPMDDDDDDAIKDSLPHDNEMQTATTTVVEDSSKFTLTPHKDAIYAICSHYDDESKMLSIVSGAGDDRAFLHFLSSDSTVQQPTTIPLVHPHTDSISSVAINNAYVNSDVSGKPQKKLVAVGSYDGAIVLYDAVDGTLVKVLEGPSDVEWCCFHPKGGTVSLVFIEGLSCLMFMMYCVYLNCWMIYMPFD